MAIPEIQERLSRDLGRPAGRGIRNFVCAEVGYGLLFTTGDNPDAMIERFSDKPFHFICKDPNKATEWADKGALVVAGPTKAAMSYTSKHPSVGFDEIVLVPYGGRARKLF